MNAYLIAQDLARWLINTRKLSIHGGFDDNPRKELIDGRFVDVPRLEGDKIGKNTWNLIGLMSANFENLEHVDISREGFGLYLPAIFERLACPRLKTLQLHGISESKHQAVQLEPEVLSINPYRSVGDTSNQLNGGLVESGTNESPNIETT